MGDTAKIIELVGTSTESWEHAAQTAVDDAGETLEGITGVKVVSQTANLGEDGTIQEYRTTVHVSFGLQR